MNGEDLQRQTSINIQEKANLILCRSHLKNYYIGHIPKV